MTLKKPEAVKLAKMWRLGNRFRKKSLVRQYNLQPADSKNTGRVKMGIRIDIENRPREYYPALDDDGGLIFFSGNPIKRIPLSDLFTPPKARKESMVNHKLEIVKTILSNEDSELLEQFIEDFDFDVKRVSVLTIKENFKKFKIRLSEATEFQLIAQKTDGTELKSAWYKTENELADMQQKCEDSDNYESTTVLKRVVDVDEDEEDTLDYTDGAEQEAEQEFPQEEESGEVEENKAKAYEELRQLYNLTNLALRQIPGSPKQRETIKKLNKLRKSLGMKPLIEMEIDINDEINEARMPAMKYVIYDKKTKEVYAASTNPFDKFKMSDVARDNKVNKSDLVMKKMAKGQSAGERLKEYVEESKVFDKIKFKGSDKKLASSVVDMIKSKAKPKDIAKSFKKLKTPSQELIMKALGDKSAQAFLQKGQLLNQLIGLFDEIEPKGLDGRSKDFRDKLKKLEYNKKKKLPYEMFEAKVNEKLKPGKIDGRTLAGKIITGEVKLLTVSQSNPGAKQTYIMATGKPSVMGAPPDSIYIDATGSRPKGSGLAIGFRIEQIKSSEIKRDGSARVELK